MRAALASNSSSASAVDFGLPWILGVLAATGIAVAFLVPWALIVVGVPLVFALSALEYEPFLLLVIFLLPVGWLLKTDVLIHDVMTTARIVVVGGFFTGRLLRGSDVRGLFRPSLSRWSFLFGCAAILSIVFGTEGWSHNSARSLALLVSSLLFYLFLVAWADSKERVQRVVQVLLYSTIITSIFAIFQEMVGDYTSLWLYLYPPDEHLAPWDYRATSFLNYANSLAGYLELILPLALACCVFGNGRCKRLGLGALGLGAVALLCTQSRAGIVAFCCFVIVVIFLLIDTWSKRIFLCLGLGGIAAALYFVGMAISPERAGDLGLSSSIGRLVLWGTAWNMFSHSPVFGIGLGNFVDSYGYYFKLSWLDAGYLTVNNLYLEVLSETGILGFVSFFTLLVLAAVNAYRYFRWQLDPFARALSLGVFGAMVVVLVHGVLDLTLDVSPQFDTLLWAIIALLVSQLRLGAECPKRLIGDSVARQSG